jgi:hypothetical protein
VIAWRPELPRPPPASNATLGHYRDLEYNNDTHAPRDISPRMAPLTSSGLFIRPADGSVDQRHHRGRARRGDRKRPGCRRQRRYGRQDHGARQRNRGRPSSGSTAFPTSSFPTWRPPALPRWEPAPRIASSSPSARGNWSTPCRGYAAGSRSKSAARSGRRSIMT